MGILDPLTDKITVGAHITRSRFSRGRDRLAARISADAQLRNTRWQLRSYEGRAFFDANKLGKHFIRYNTYKKFLRRYEIDDKELAPKPLIKIFRDYEGGRGKKGRPEVFKAVFAHEISKFSYYFGLYVNAIPVIERDISDWVAQDNMSLFTKEGEMKKLIASIPRIANKEQAMAITAQFEEFKHKVAGPSITRTSKEIKKEVTWDNRIATKFEEPIRGFSGWWASHLVSGHWLSHKAQKIARRLLRYEYHRFNKRVTELREAINRGDATYAFILLKSLFQEYNKISKYYFNIDKDLKLIIGKLLHEAQVVLDRIALPFYGVVKQHTEANVNEILQSIQNLRKDYMSFRYESTREEWELKKVFEELKNLAETCNSVVKDIQKANVKILENLRREYSLPGSPGGPQNRMGFTGGAGI
ncbi:hypothetical protein JXA85_07850 [Candidatus Woesearchaeota archaeon]|nr:hypothetical protein [Candidatus Woesearchaeota archaeon]